MFVCQVMGEQIVDLSCSSPTPLTSTHTRRFVEEEAEEEDEKIAGNRSVLLIFFSSLLEMGGYLK